MKLFVCIADDARLLPHFLKHYEACGISGFFIAGPPHLTEYVGTFSPRFSIQFFDTLDVEDSILGGNLAVTSMRRSVQSVNEWAVIVDLDEFVEFPEPVGKLVEKIDATGSNVVKGIMYDRFAMNGKIVGFDDQSILSEIYPVKARFIKNVMNGQDKKCVMVKGDLVPENAHHKFYDAIDYPEYFEISHYKWNDLSLDRLRSAYDRITQRKIPWAIEYKRILDHYEQNGRFAWETFGGELA